MESNFWSVQVKRAWDSVPQVQEAQPPLLPSFSEDHGPWPLSFYPVLGAISSDVGGDYQEQPLPVWMNDFAGIYPRTDSCRVQSTSEPSIPDSVSAIHEEQPEKPTTLGTWEDVAEESFRVAMQPWSCSRASHRGNDAKDTESCSGSSSTECEQPSGSGEVDSGLCQDAWRAFVACLFCGLLQPDSGSSEP
ncbi:annexin-2 receptor [Mus caroli]|uniref:Annexin-2 receptor n=1 Tax=Mus caroli TaxID=10089 RepID=A0A6P5P4Y6_MUSCR|nr:annexin-2 receptor [Mus caroli]